MLFSIVIPVYNVEKYLDECIQSIITQTESIGNDCEILLIDDGSTDKSGEICDTYGARFPNIFKVFHKENEGLLATRRFGYKRASGDYVINCDSDDLLEDDMLITVKTIIMKYDAPDIIFINHNIYDGHVKKVAFENIFTSSYDSVVTKEDVLRVFLTGHSIVSVWGKIVKRTSIDIDREYKEYGRLSTGEDTLQSIEFLTDSNTFVYLNKALYDYRCGSGMTAKFDDKYYFTFRKIFEEIAKKKQIWNLDDYEILFSTKVLQTAGRAITQSRYEHWDSMNSQKEYLVRISEDTMFQECILHLPIVKNKLQKNHWLLLWMLKHQMIMAIVVLLSAKNILNKYLRGN